MIDVNAVVESSTATEAAPNYQPETFTPAQHTEWMKTGKVPDVKPEADSSSAVKEVVPTESAAGSQQQEKELGKAGQARIRELAAENKELKARLAAPVVTAKSTPAKAAKAPPEYQETGHESESWATFEIRKVEHLVQTTLSTERAERERERVEADTVTANKAVEDQWQERVDATAAELKMSREEFSAVAFSKSLNISQAMDEFIADSEIGPKVLHHLATNLEEGNAIAAMPAWKAARALIKIEDALSTAAPDKKIPAPVVPITKAARPATDLKATNAAPADERKAAIEADDFQRFNEIENQKLLARRRG